MDNTTPFHPDIQPLTPDPNGQRHGQFVTAFPHNRSMYRTKFILRLTSMLITIIIIGILGRPAGGYDPYSYLYSDSMNWAFGAPVAVAAFVWNSIDILIMIIKDRGLRWSKSRLRNGRTRDARFSWGHPGGHVTAHLLLWLSSGAMGGLILSTYFRIIEEGYYSYDNNQRRTQLSLGIFMYFQLIIHFILFVFACVATDNLRRQYSDVVFVPREDLREMVPVPPTNLWEVFRSKRLPLAYFANHYVRFVPGADGTVQVARDYSSRQARF